MKCPKCNEEIADGAKFCTKCGVNIEEEKARIAEKEEAIRKAKEEGLELEIIDKKPEPEPEEKPVEFKNKEEAPKKKKQKVKIKKNIFQVIINKLIFIIIVAALIIGGVYYCYTQDLLPEFAQNQVKEFDETLQNVIKLNNEVNDKKKSTTTSADENKTDLEESKNETNSVDVKENKNETNSVAENKNEVNTVNENKTDSTENKNEADSVNTSNIAPVENL